MAATPLTMAAETSVVVCTLITLDPFKVRDPNASTNAILPKGTLPVQPSGLSSVTFLTSGN